MSFLKKLDKWHRTKPGYTAFGLAELLIAYGFASWAIDNGNLLLYALTIIFFAGFIRNFLSVFHPHKK